LRTHGAIGSAGRLHRQGLQVRALLRPLNEKGVKVVITYTYWRFEDDLQGTTSYELPDNCDTYTVTNTSLSDTSYDEDIVIIHDSPYRRRKGRQFLEEPPDPPPRESLLRKLIKRKGDI
jgi:hypothetical protein